MDDFNLEPTNIHPEKETTLYIPLGNNAEENPWDKVAAIIPRPILDDPLWVQTRMGEEVAEFIYNNATSNFFEGLFERLKRLEMEIRH
jgi:hypothetical protein